MKINFKKIKLKHKYNFIISIIFIVLSFFSLILANYFFSQKNYKNNLNLINYKKFIFAITQNKYNPETIINILIKNDQFEKDKFLGFLTKKNKAFIEKKIGFLSKNNEYFEQQKLLSILKKNFYNFNKNSDNKNFIDKIKENYLSILKNQNIYHTLNLKFLHKSMGFLNKLTYYFNSFLNFKLFLEFLSFYNNKEFKETINNIFSIILSSFNKENNFYFYLKKILSPFNKNFSFLKKFEKIFSNKKLLNFLNIIKIEFLSKKKIKNFSDFFLLFSKKENQIFLISLYKKLFYFKTLKLFVFNGKSFLKKNKKNFNEIEKETWKKLFILNNENVNWNNLFNENKIIFNKWKNLYKQILKKILFIYNENDEVYKIKYILNFLWENGVKISKNNNNILLLYKYKYFFNLNFYKKILNSKSASDFIENKKRIFEFLKDYYYFSFSKSKNNFFNYLKNIQNYSFENENIDIKSNKGNNFHLHIIKDEDKNNLFKVSFNKKVKYFFLNKEELNKLKRESLIYKIEKIKNPNIIIKNFWTNKKIYFLSIFKNIIKKLYTMLPKFYKKLHLKLKWNELIKKFPIFKNKLYNLFLKKKFFKKIIKFSVRSYFFTNNIYTKFFYLNVRNYKKIIFKISNVEEILTKINKKKFLYFNYSNYSYFSIIIKYFLKFIITNNENKEYKIKKFLKKFKNISNDLINFFLNNEIFRKKIKKKKIKLIDIFHFLKTEWDLQNKNSKEKKKLKKIFLDEKENIFNRFLIQKIIKFLEVQVTFRNLINLKNFNFFFKNIFQTLKIFFNKKINFIFNFLIQLFKKIDKNKEKIVNFENWKFFNLYFFFNNIFKNFYFDDKSLQLILEKFKKNIKLFLKLLEKKINFIQKKINNKWNLTKHKIKFKKNFFLFNNFEFNFKKFKINKKINN